MTTSLTIRATLKNTKTNESHSVAGLWWMDTTESIERVALTTNHSDIVAPLVYGLARDAYDKAEADLNGNIDSLGCLLIARGWRADNVIISDGDKEVIWRDMPGFEDEDGTATDSLHDFNN